MEELKALIENQLSSIGGSEGVKRRRKLKENSIPFVSPESGKWKSLEKAGVVLK